MIVKDSNKTESEGYDASEEIKIDIDDNRAYG
jgi:hypothetical protein